MRRGGEQREGENWVCLRSCLMRLRLHSGIWRKAGDVLCLYDFFGVFRHYNPNVRQ